MKCVIPEIAYHNRDPVLSIDFQLTSSDGLTRLATAGSDNHVVIWSVTRSPEGDVSLECLCDLTRHQKAVNIVRWSPDGKLLASGDDESVIIVWQLKPGDSGCGGGLFDDDHENKENWVVYKMIRSHLDDVYDLSWSGCGQFLLSGSVDNAAIITNVHKNNKVAHFSDSRGYVQGVSWNKKHNLVSTLSSDRACRTYNTATKKIVTKSYKANLNLNDEAGKKKKVVGPSKQSEAAEGAKEESGDSKNSDDKKGEEKSKGGKGAATGDRKAQSKEKEVRLYHDETFKGFFRRLSWSNDGEILAAPSGVLETDDSNKMSHCTWVYTRVDMSKPVLCLPTKDKYTTAVRFNPQLFKLRPLKSGKQQTPVDTDKPWLAAKSLFALPYRMVYAVATQNAIMFYDTQQVAPWGRVSNVHYTGLTDLAWSPCGNILFASSSDGYCSIVSFAPGEIGELYSEESASSDSKLATDVKEVAGESKKKSKSSKSEQINIVKENKSNAKRLQFVTLSSPKANKKASKPAKVVETKAGEEMIEMNLDCDEGSLGVQRMETDDNDDLRLVLEETEPEPFKKAATTATTPEAAVVSSQSQVVDGQKRVPLTTLMTQGPNTGSGAAATPEKGKGRRVNLITLSSPKPKA